MPGTTVSIPIMRQEPILAMGILSMVIQGTVFALLFPVFNRGGLLLGLVHQKFPAPAR